MGAFVLFFKANKLNQMHLFCFLKPTNLNDFIIPTFKQKEKQENLLI